MKRIAFLILSVLLTVSVFAQDPGATEKNAGNAAVKAKNYPEAFKQYEAYLKIVNNKDNATVYNTAYCATKIKNYAAAEKYFDMSANLLGLLLIYTPSYLQIQYYILLLLELSYASILQL